MEPVMPETAATLAVLPSAIQTALGRIRANPPGIKKYFILDENRAIVVKADHAEIRHDTGQTENFGVVYDLGNSQEDGGGFRVPFTLRSLDTGETLEDTLFWKPERDSAGLLLAFDDDYTEAWENNFDLFDQFGARVTFFVQGEPCLFCVKALERGHDVGYHSLNHLNLPKVSRGVFDRETASMAPAFRNAGVPVGSFAYPFGLSEPWMHEELLKTFRILRGYGVTFMVYGSEEIRKGYITSRALDNILFRADEDFNAAVDIMFRAVKFIGGDLVLPLTTHNISDNADWGIKPLRLRYLLQSANKLQLNFYLFRDFIE
jgi:hypothetical protein